MSEIEQKKALGEMALRELELKKDLIARATGDKFTSPHWTIIIGIVPAGVCIGLDWFTHYQQGNPYSQILLSGLILFSLVIDLRIRNIHSRMDAIVDILGIRKKINKLDQ